VNALHKLLALSWRERFLLLEAFFYLGVARAALLTIPFKRIVPYLGQQMKKEDIHESDSPPMDSARQVGWAVDIMSRRTPWESACLVQAIAGKIMLKQRGLPSLLYLGTKKDETGQLTAHAWLKNGNEILLGGSGHETFTVLSAFVDTLNSN